MKDTAAVPPQTNYFIALFENKNIIKEELHQNVGGTVWGVPIFWLSPDLMNSIDRKCKESPKAYQFEIHMAGVWRSLLLHWPLIKQWNACFKSPLAFHCYSLVLNQAQSALLVQANCFQCNHKLLASLFWIASTFSKKRFPCSSQWLFCKILWCLDVRRRHFLKIKPVSQFVLSKMDLL